MEERKNRSRQIASGMEKCRPTPKEMERQSEDRCRWLKFEPRKKKKEEENQRKKGTNVTKQIRKFKFPSVQ